jgi:hypothetical protein
LDDFLSFSLSLLPEDFFADDDCCFLGVRLCFFSLSLMMSWKERGLECARAGDLEAVLACVGGGTWRWCTACWAALVERIWSSLARAVDSDSNDPNVPSTFRRPPPLNFMKFVGPSPATGLRTADTDRLRPLRATSDEAS